jgi:hypothetical protein
MLVKSLIVFFSLSIGFVSFSQCAAPEKIAKTSSKGNFTVNKQSKSGALIPGGSYELSFTAQEGYDYRIMSGTDGRGKTPVPFEVIEMVTEKDGDGGFKKTRKTINSSTGDEPVTFKSERTATLLVIVTLPANESKKPECVAVLIEDRKSTKIGF